VFGTNASPLNVAFRLPAIDPTAAEPASIGISPIPITATTINPTCISFLMLFTPFQGQQ